MNSFHWPHRIARHRFELEAGNEPQAKVLQDQISENYADRIVRVLEEVLDEFDQPDLLVRLDFLEIDLGELSEDAFIHQLCDALRKELRNELAAAIRRIPFQHKENWKELPQSGKISLKSSQLEQLTHFLQYGYFPSWQAGKLVSPLELWQKVKSNQPQLLVQALTQLKDSQGVGSRLNRMLPPAEKVWVLEQLLPGFDGNHQSMEKGLIRAIQSLPYLNIASSEIQAWIRQEYSAWLKPESWPEQNWRARLMAGVIAPLLKHPEVMVRGLTPEMTVTRMAEELATEEKQLFLSELDRIVTNSLSLFSPEDKGEDREAIVVPPIESRTEEHPHDKENIGPTEMVVVNLADWLSPQGWVDWVLVLWLTGESPWWAETFSQSVATPLVLKLIFQHHATALSQALNVLASQPLESGQRRKLAAALTEELAEDQRFHLLGKLEPQTAGFFFALFQAIEQYEKETTVAANSLSSSFWQSFWEEWLLQGGKELTLGPMTRQILHRMASKVAQTEQTFYPEFQTWIRKKVQAGEKRWFPIQTMLLPFSSQEEVPREEQPEEEIPQTIDSPGRRVEGLSIEEEKESKEIGELQKIRAEELAEVSFPGEGDSLELQEEKQGSQHEEEKLKGADWMAELPLDIQRSLLAEGHPEVGRQQELAWILRHLSYLLRHGSLPIESPKEGSWSSRSIRELENWLQMLLTEAPKSYRLLVERMLVRKVIRQRVARQLSRRELALLTQGLGHVRGGDWPDMIQAFLAIEPILPDLETVWSWRGTLLSFLMEKKDRSPVPYQLFHRLIRMVHRRGRLTASALLQQIETNLPTLSIKESADLAAYVQLMQRELAKQPLLRPPTPEEENKQQAREIRHGSIPITMSNAGLVLVWPFFPHYFKMLELLTPLRQFKGESAQGKAPHFLQYLVNKQTDAPEEDLVLNKLLCGIPFEATIPDRIEMTEAEQELGEGLIQAAIQQWGALKNASPDGMRGSFFIRQGSLSPKGKHWEIQVETKPYDLLIDRLPWGLSVIKFPWMTQALHVQWR